MRFRQDDLRREARAIAASGKGARQAWTELRQWASGRGPAAMKFAMMEFVSEFGGTPDAAFVMPQIMGAPRQELTPSERASLLRLAAPMPQAGRPGQAPARLAPVNSLPVSANRPSLAVAFSPQNKAGIRPVAPGMSAIEPLTPSAGHAYLRDMPVIMRDRLEAARALRPHPAEALRQDGMAANAARPPHHGVHSGSYLGAQKGEHIVRGLIGQLRSHGSDSAPGPSSMEGAARSSPSRRKPRSRAKRRRAASSTRRRTKAPARTAARKASRRTAARRGSRRNPARSLGRRKSRKPARSARR